MHRYIVIILILLFQSCTNNRHRDSACENNSNSEASMEPILMDSIEIEVKPEGRDQDNLTICIYNPTSDTICLHQTYYINDNSRKCSNNNMVIGRSAGIPALLFPHEEATFKVNLGLDSVEYRKESSYNLTIKGKSKNRNFLFYRILRLGNRYKMKDETILEPDTVIFPLSYIN